MIVVELDAVWANRNVFLGSLAPGERAIFDALRVEKRAKDWLAGRIAAKRAVQRELGLPFSRIVVRANANGRPEVAGAHISIAHSGALAIAIAAHAPIGIDLEQIEHREESFVETFLDANERAEVAHLEGRARDREITRRWCRKEAIAKLLGVGLARPFGELVLPPRAELEEGSFAHRNVEYCWAKARAG